MKTRFIFSADSASDTRTFDVNFFVPNLYVGAVVDFVEFAGHVSSFFTKVISDNDVMQIVFITR